MNVFRELFLFFFCVPRAFESLASSRLQSFQRVSGSFKGFRRSKRNFRRSRGSQGASGTFFLKGVPGSLMSVSRFSDGSKGFYVRFKGSWDFSEDVKRVSGGSRWSQKIPGS